jgi:hypothetical protein
MMHIVRILSLLFFTAMGSYAVFLASEDRDISYVKAIADRLEHGQTVTISQVATAADIVLTKSASHHCRSDILRPAVFVAMYNLNRTNQAKDYDQWASLHGESQSYLATVVRCTPANGNVWLRDAFVERAISEDPTSLRRKMLMASQLMPYEEQQVLARLSLWKRLSGHALSECDDLARADIRAVLLYGSDKMKKALNEGMSPEFSVLVKNELSKTTLPSATLPSVS